MNINEISIERCELDEENPYVLISRAMLHDKNLSLQAKGILCYLLSLPKGWKISHSQLARALNCGETIIRKTLNELIEVGGDNINEYIVRLSYVR